MIITRIDASKFIKQAVILGGIMNEQNRTKFKTFSELIKRDLRMNWQAFVGIPVILYFSYLIIYQWSE